jgi:flagellar hook-basal body protein
MAGISAIGSAISEINRSIGTGAGNIAASGADAEKGFNTSFKAKIVPNGKGGYQFAGVTTKTKQRIGEQGDIIGSTKGTHIAINGSGFIPVSLVTDKNEIVYTRLGDFEINRDGHLVNGNGYALRAWKLDDLQRKPGERGNSDVRGSSEITSLDLVNIKSLSSRPKATKVVSLNARLDASSDVIKGSGQIFRFKSEDEFNFGITMDEVIVPSANGINQNDTLSIIMGEPITTEEYIYGGVISSFNIKKTPILASTDPSNTFKITAPDSAPDAHSARLGDKIRVRVGTEAAVDLKFVSNTPRASAGEFNSLLTLRDSLNAIKGLTARVSGNTLYIAAKDGVSGVTFGDIGESKFVEKLGLSNIEAAPAGQKRYSTMGKLKDLLQDNPSLRVYKEESGGLDISAKRPTEGIKFKSTSERKNEIRYISAVQPGGTHKVEHNKYVKIFAPHNGLRVGDIVRINGLNTSGKLAAGENITENGLYAVTAADEGSFTIAAQKKIAIPADLHPQAGVETRISMTGEPTWQKTSGSVDQEHIVEANMRVQVHNGQVTFEMNSDPGYAEGDMIWISNVKAGAKHVEDGYYRVVPHHAQGFQGAPVQPAFKFTIEVPGMTALGGAIEDDILEKENAAKFRKIGRADPASQLVVGQSQTFTHVVGSKNVKVSMRNHSFGIDDYVSFGGNGLNPLLEDKMFKIVSVTTHDFLIEFESEADALAAVAGPNGRYLPASAYIDFRGKLNQDIGLRQDLDNVYIDAVYSATGGEGRDLATGTFNGIWENTIVVFDELGIAHNLRLAFAKISANSWAAQLYARKDELTGEYPVRNPQNNGILASGVVHFNGSGTIQSIEGIDSEITLNWNSSSNPTTIKINLGETADKGSSFLYTSGGLKHVKGDNEVFSLDQDGYAPGKFIGLALDAETGSLIASYDNGQTQSVYKIPICYFAAESEMEAVASATYKPTYESGDVVLKDSGDDGVGRYTGSAREESNIEQTDEMSGLIEHTQLFSINASAFSLTSEAQKEFIRRT